MATKTIGSGGDHLNIQLWEDSLPATLTSPEVGQLLNQTFTAGVTFAGTTTSASNTITLECAAGASWKDHASKATNPQRPSSSYGAILSITGANAVTVGVSYVTIRGLQIDVLTANFTCIGMSGTPDYLAYDNCLCRAVSPHTSGRGLSIWGANSQINNCVLIIDSTTTVPAIRTAVGAKIRGTTVLRPAVHGVPSGSVGILTAYTAIDVAGCAIFGFDTPLSSSSGTNALTDYNATDAATILGSGGHNLTGQSYSACIENTGSTAANIDARLKAGSPLIGAWVASPGLTTDSAGQPRPSGTLADIGAWEYQAVVASGAPVGLIGWCGGMFEMTGGFDG